MALRLHKFVRRRVMPSLRSLQLPCAFGSSSWSSPNPPSRDWPRPSSPPLHSYRAPLLKANFWNRSNAMQRAVQWRVLIQRQTGPLPRQLPYSLLPCDRTHYAPAMSCCLLSSRSISFVSTPKGDLPLLSSLRSQIEHENRVSSVQESLRPPEPFKLIGNPDAREVVLRRTFEEEDIEIVCVFHDLTYGDNEGEEDLGPPPPPDLPMKMVQMTIKISVGSNEPFLQIVCCTYGNKSSIEQVLLRNHDLKLKEAPFEGPEISLLSDKVKSGIVQYLEARGIDNELGKFLLSYVPQSTQQKTACWLAKVERFLKA